MKQLLLTTVAVALTCTLIACDTTNTDYSTQREALAAVDRGALLVDVRSAEEVKAGMIEGAINIPHTAIVPGVTALKVDKDQPIVVYCRSGNRSGKAAQALSAAGFTQVINGGAYVDLRTTQLALTSETESTGPEEACDEPSCA